MNRADERAIELYSRLQTIREDFPLLGVKISPSKKLVIYEKADSSFAESVSVAKVLRFNLKSALLAGGTLSALLASAYPANLRVPEVAVFEDVDDRIRGD